MNIFFGATNTLKFQATGKWDEASRLLGSLDRDLKEVIVASQVAVAKKIVKVVKGHLRNQDLPWQPLSQEYAKRKKQWRADSRILIATQAYYDNIDIWYRKNGWQVFMGVKKGIYSRTLDGQRSRLDIATIATIHEYGRDGKTRRQLWNPSIRELGNTPGIRNLYLEEIEKRLKKKAKWKPYLVRLSKF